MARTREEYHTEWERRTRDAWASNWQLYTCVRRHYGDLPIASVSRPRLGVFARRDTTHFLSPVLTALRRDFEIYRYYTFSDDLITDVAKHLDVLWIEWGAHAFILADLEERIAGGAQIATRLIDWEIADPEHGRLPEWNAADTLLFINADSEATFLANFPHYPQEKRWLIPCSVDERQFPFFNRVYGKRILLTSLDYSPRKEYQRAIEIFRRVVRLDPEFELVIKADYTLRHRSYFDQCMRMIQESGLNDRVSLVMRRPEYQTHRLLHSKMDILPIYREADVILSTSNHEAYHYAIAEGMLTGTYAVVYPWEWGQPRTLWGPYVADDLESAAHRIVEWGNLSQAEKIQQGRIAREYVIENFGLETSRKKYLQVLSGKTQPLESPATTKRLILFAHHHLYRWKPHGGEISMRNVIKKLQAEDFDVLVVVHNKKTKDYLREYYQDVPFIVIPQGPDFVPACAEILDWWQPDVALMWGTVAGEVAELCIGRALPYVLFVRYWHLVNSHPYIDLLADPIDVEHNRRHRHVFVGARHIITNARHVSRAIKRMYGVDSLVSYVPVDPLPVINRPKRYITLINARKAGGGELISRLAARMPDTNFLIIDQNSEVTYPANVSTRPYSDEPYNELLADTRLLLFPFDEEPCGTGRVAYEAQLLGIPVISVNRGGIPEALPGAHLVQINEDIDEWEALIHQILDNYGEAQSRTYAVMADYSADNERRVITEAIRSAAEDTSVQPEVHSELLSARHQKFRLLGYDESFSRGTVYCSQQSLLDSGGRILNNLDLEHDPDGSVKLRIRNAHSQLTLLDIIEGEHPLLGKQVAAVPNEATGLAVAMHIDASVDVVTFMLTEYVPWHGLFERVRRKVRLHTGNAPGGLGFSQHFTLHPHTRYVSIGLYNHADVRGTITIRDLEAVYTSLSQGTDITFGDYAFEEISLAGLTATKRETRLLEFIERPLTGGSIDTCFVALFDPRSSEQFWAIARDAIATGSNVAVAYPKAGRLTVSHLQQQRHSAPSDSGRVLASGTRLRALHTAYRIRRALEPAVRAKRFGSRILRKVYRTARQIMRHNPVGNRLAKRLASSVKWSDSLGDNIDYLRRLPVEHFHPLGAEELLMLVKARLASKTVLNTEFIPIGRLLHEHPDLRDRLTEIESVVATTEYSRTLVDSIVGEHKLQTEIAVDCDHEEQEPRYQLVQDDKLHLFLYVGQDLPHLGIVLEALGQVADARLNLIGDFSQNLIRDVQELAKAYKVSQRVFFLNYPPLDQAVDVITQGGVGLALAPSYDDYIRFVAAGIPAILCGEDPSNARRFAHPLDIYVPEIDAGQLAEAIAFSVMRVRGEDSRPK